MTFLPVISEERIGFSKNGAGAVVYPSGKKMQLYVYLSLLSWGELQILKVKRTTISMRFLKEIRGKYLYDEEGFIKHEM